MRPRQIRLKRTIAHLLRRAALHITVRLHILANELDPPHLPDAYATYGEVLLFDHVNGYVTTVNPAVLDHQIRAARSARDN